MLAALEKEGTTAANADEATILQEDLIYLHQIQDGFVFRHCTAYMCNRIFC